MDLGLRRGIVKLVPHRPAWKELFAEEKDRLEEVIGHQVVDIQHIGSTSIPGMVAKPILDIGIAVVDFEASEVSIDPIEGLGYQYRGEHGIPRRHYFVKGNPRTHHLHMLEVNSRDWKAHLLFRSYLTSHPDIAQEYAELKIDLAERYRTDREVYQEGKDAFIERILELAEVEKGN